MTQHTELITGPEIRKRICSLLAYSLTDIELDFYRAKKLLRILKDLVYPEVVWLIYYSTYSQRPLSPESVETQLPDKSDFELEHQNLLKSDRFTLVGAQRDMDNEALQRSYKNTLLRLNLIEEIEKDSSRNYRITAFGYLVVRYILSPQSAS